MGRYVFTVSELVGKYVVGGTSNCHISVSDDAAAGYMELLTASSRALPGLSHLKFGFGALVHFVGKCRVARAFMI